MTALPTAEYRVTAESVLFHVVPDAVRVVALGAADVDVALLTKTLDYITAHPQEWNQASWVRRTPCGTTACLAGTAVQLAGYDIDWTRGAHDIDDDATIAVMTTAGPGVPDLAAKLLGLNQDAFCYLFYYPGDDVGELWRRAAEVTAGRVEVPLEYAL